jgi:predicted transcriptional regulator
MKTLALTLSDQEAAMLRDVAAASGARPEEFAAAAVRECLAQDAAWIAAVETGVAQIDAGEGMAFEEYGVEMDVFLAALEGAKA